MTCAPIIPDTVAAIALLKLVYPEGPRVAYGYKAGPQGNGHKNLSSHD